MKSETMTGSSFFKKVLALRRRRANGTLTQNQAESMQNALADTSGTATLTGGNGAATEPTPKNAFSTVKTYTRGQA